MAATTYGTIGRYGAADENGNGVYIASYSLTSTVQTATYGDHVGDVKGLAVYGEQAEISAAGVTTSNSTAGSGAVGTVLAWTANSELWGGADTGASSFAVTSITLSRSQNDFMTADISAIGFPGITVS